MSRSTVPVLRLWLIALLAVLVHGYHLGVDDAEIYVPGIKKAADPTLYPFGSQFFMAHAHLSLFSDLVGNFARWTFVPVNLVIFLFHIAGIFLLLVASWLLLCACFSSEPARWGGVVTLAAVLTVPVAGTALVIMDPYLTARSLSTPFTIFAVVCYVTGRPRQALAWLLATAVVHPLMSAYGIVFLGCLVLARKFELYKEQVAISGARSVFALAFLFGFEPASGPAREALFSRTYLFVTNWTWYEWIGVFAPLGLAWCLTSPTLRATTPVFRLVLRTLVPFGISFTCAGLVLSLSPRLENFARVQPMRSFHLVYVIFFLMLGGLIGEYALRSTLLRWFVLFAPLAVCMYLVQRNCYASSSHLEWPGSADVNKWNSAFVWAREHTPKSAIFALDPDYILRTGEDSQGFRAIAERSALADDVKDGGVVSMFPELAGEWKKETNAQRGWAKFKSADFENLARHYPVTWIVTLRPAPRGMDCPYRNKEIAVCSIRAGAGVRPVPDR
ncbi:MAG: hypothetical protein M3Y27_18185 [Acidobacteriota bacterium]|nr:hypothetical protein [Acidobacteriota bacterium]